MSEEVGTVHRLRSVATQDEELHDLALGIADITLDFSYTPDYGVVVAGFWGGHGTVIYREELWAPVALLPEASNHVQARGRVVAARPYRARSCDFSPDDEHALAELSARQANLKQLLPMRVVQPLDHANANAYQYRFIDR